MLKKLPYYFIIGSLFFLGLFSCKKDQKDAEKTLLSEYLESHNITEEPQNSGLYVVETGFSTSLSKEAVNPAEGDTVFIMYKGYLLSDSTVVFDEKTYDNPVEYVYLKDEVIPGWEEAVGLMKKNTPALIIIPSDLAYKGRQTGIIPPYSTLIFEARILDIIKP
jgi:FKBP-type peptidyl-prolyl cis-trans isomerase